MELIRISERKLKIMLTPTDMCHFELYDGCFDGDGEEMHRAFRLLLDEVRRQTDFEGDDRHLSIQYFPSRGGGCEMFISRLGGDGEEHGALTEASLPAPKANEKATALGRHLGCFRRDCVYRFGELSHLLRACNRLIGVKAVCESHAYRDEIGDYLLFLTVLSPSPFSLPCELDFLAEYGSPENAALLRLYIKEHAKLISSPDAVEILGVLC